LSLADIDKKPFFDYNTYIKILDVLEGLIITAGFEKPVRGLGVLEYPVFGDDEKIIYHTLQIDRSVDITLIEAFIIDGVEFKLNWD